MDEQFYREKLKTIRELTSIADPFIKRRLIQLAIRYEKELITAKAKEEDQRDNQNSSEDFSSGSATRISFSPPQTPFRHRR
jgi:hypothetical protein